MTGAGLTKVCLLAEHPDDCRHWMFDRLLRRSGRFTRDSFYYATASDHDVLSAMQARGVRVVVPLGERALRQTLGQTGLMRWRGRVVEHPQLPGAWVVPTFAPADLLPKRGDEDDYGKMRHPPRFSGTWVWDLIKAATVQREGFTRRPVNYLGDPSPDVFSQWAFAYFQALKRDPELYLSWDIETPYKTKTGDEEEVEQAEGDDPIIRISFSYEAGTAVSMPWAGPWLGTIKALLQAEGPKVVWNGSTFDVPKVEANGVNVGGAVFDYMDGWHVYQSDLDKGLEFVTSFCTDLLPWKHLSGADPVWYSCTDADAALRNALAIREWLKKEGQWKAFYDHSVRLMPILREAGQRGNLIDVNIRQELVTEFDAIKADLTVKAQDMVPRELKPRQLYKRLPDNPAPPGPDGLLQADYRVTDNRMVWWDGTEFDVVRVPGPVKFCTVCHQPASNKSEHFKGGKKNPCKAAGGDIEVRTALVPEYHKVLPFNPNSGPQVKSYITFYGHPMGQDKNDSSKESCDAKHLKDLRKRYGAAHPLYDLVLQFHLVSKARGTYCPLPDANGLIHTTYKNSPSTWRLGSANINMQNWGKRDGNPYAQKARKQIIARPGRQLVQIDSSSVEAVMLGYFMGDTAYMTLASQSIHAWLCCKALGWAFTPENVDKIKETKKGLYDAYKVANHMTNYGGGPAVLYASNPEVFGSKKGAEAIQSNIFQLLPALYKFHHQVRQRAQKETFLRNPWGHKHYFYDVFTVDRFGKVKYGKDAKRCVAYLPQSSNGSFQRDNILLAAATYTADGHCLREWMPANLSVHDSLCLDVPDAYVDEVAELLKVIFSRPIPEMQNIRIGAEVEVGLNWKQMKSVGKVVISDYSLQEAA